tara:strand:+ start:57 stop:254 length:198 start_codon:yes stop_codon:yes gene_type:complete
MLEQATDHTVSWQAKHIFERVGKTYLVKSSSVFAKRKGKTVTRKISILSIIIWEGKKKLSLMNKM